MLGGHFEKQRVYLETW